MKRFVYIVLAVFALALVAEQAQAHGRSQFRSRNFRSRGASFSLNFGGGYGGNDAAFRAGFRAAQRQQFNGYGQSFRLNLGDHCN